MPKRSVQMLTKVIIAIAASGSVVVSCYAAPSPAAPPVTVQKTDDSTVSGNLISSDGASLVIDVQRTASPTTQETVRFNDISQVSFQSPRPAKDSPEATAAHGEDNPPVQNQPSDRQDSRALFKTSLRNIFGFDGRDTGAGPGSGAASPNASPAATEPAAPASQSAAPASQPAANPVWKLNLEGGDHLQATISDWSHQTLTLSPSALPHQAIRLPQSQVRDLWCGADALQSKARTHAIDLATGDAVFVQKGDDIVPVQGNVLGISGQFLAFRYGDEDRKIALGKVVGILLAPANQAAPGAAPEQNEFSAFHQVATLQSGDVLSGAWIGGGSDSLRYQLLSQQTITIPFDQLTTIRFLNGRRVYLSDLSPTLVEQTPFFGRMIAFRVDTDLEGHPIHLSDGNYAHGVAMHARTLLHYDIGGQFARFTCKLGFEQPGGKLGRSVVRVSGDGKTLFEDLDAHGDQPPKNVDVDVAGVHQLVLQVDFGKSQDVGARVIWANALLQRPDASK